MTPKWTSSRAIGLHATVIVVVPGCLVLGWWQLHRALAGNELSWAYTFEWPIFAGYGVYLWWKLIHEQPDSLPETTRREIRAQQRAARHPDLERDRRNAEKQAAAQADLDAYNSYLASLRDTSPNDHPVKDDHPVKAPPRDR